MELFELKPILEAMIFVAEEPMDEKGMLLCLEGTGVTKEILTTCLHELTQKWNDDPESGLQLKQVAGGYQFRTKETLASWLMRLNIQKPSRLSGAALETLAMIAYRQPIIRSEIEQIRGVASGGVLKKLLERRLIKIVGRRDEAGHPLIYGTTGEFLELFDLKDLKELPQLKDIEELMREHQVRTEKGPEVSLTPSDSSDDEEEPTEWIDEDDEEKEEVLAPSELISDDEAIETLETSLKDLRRVEKKVFEHVGIVLEESDEAIEKSTTESDKVTSPDSPVQ